MGSVSLAVGVASSSLALANTNETGKKKTGKAEKTGAVGAKGLEAPNNLKLGDVSSEGLFVRLDGYKPVRNRHVGIALSWENRSDQKTYRIDVVSARTGAILRTDYVDLEGDPDKDGGVHCYSNMRPGDTDQSMTFCQLKGLEADVAYEIWVRAYTEVKDPRSESGTVKVYSGTSRTAPFILQRVDVATLAGKLASAAASLLPTGCDRPKPKKAKKPEGKSAPVEKKAETPVKLDLTAAITASVVTSRSALIHYEVPNIDIDKIGPKKALLLILNINGSDTEGSSQSMIQMRTVYSRSVIHKEVLSREKMKDQNGKPMDLLPDATYEATLAYDVVSRNMNLRSYNKPGTVIATCTFKTLPDAAKSK